MSSKFNTPKARSNRKRQLERLGYDADRVADILDYEFDLELGFYPKTPLPGKSYEKGGLVEAKNKLKKVSGQLQKASNMHAQQSKKIESIANSFSNGGVIKVKRRGTFKGIF
jgi:signal transduction histidine kinase